MLEPMMLTLAPDRIGVVVVSQARLPREGLTRVLAEEPRLAVVATSTPEAASNTVREHKPDAVLVDVATPGGAECVAELVTEVPQTPVIGVAAHEDEDAAVLCLEAGGSGVLGDDLTARDVLAAIETAARGELICSPRIASLMSRRLNELSASRRESTHVPLTPQERTILHLALRGLSNKQIAERLVIGVQTVKNHMRSARAKLGLTRRRSAWAPPNDRL